MYRKSSHEKKNIPQIFDIEGEKGPMPEIVTFLFYCVIENQCLQQIIFTVSNTLVYQAH